jgi:choline transport protein
VLFLNITYVVPQGILLLSRGRSFLPMRYFRLGWFGYFCNGFSVLWIVVLGTAVCMPPSLPVSVANMNYTSPILVGLFALIMLAWFAGGRKNFQGPQVDLDSIDIINQTRVGRGGVSQG